MDMRKEMYRLLETQTEMALATCIEDQPYVRVVNFYYDEKKNVIYFTSYNKNNKVKELDANPKVAITTIPKSNEQHVKAIGIAKRSANTIYDLEEEFTHKIEGYEDNIKYAGKSLILYEIQCESFTVTLDMKHIEKIKI